MCITDLHAAVLAFPGLDRRLAHSQTPERFPSPSGRLHLLERADDLLFRMLALLHFEAPFLVGASQL